jgi:MOSC domain-containing protein YiiM
LQIAFGHSHGRRLAFATPLVLLFPQLMPGTLQRIWIKRAKLGPMDPVDVARLRTNRGLVGNANQGGRRQVTIIEAERWAEHVAAVGTAIDPSRRRANLLVRDCSLADSRGRVLRIGAVRLQIAGETKPCHQMDEVQQGLQAVMRPNWGGGAFAIVLDDGEIAVGDAVTWEPVEAVP